MTDIAGNSTTTAHLDVGDSMIGTIDVGGDHDWIAVQLVAGQKYTFTLEGYGSNALEDPYIYLRTAAGTVLAENDDGNGNRDSRLVFTATKSGTFYVDAAAWDDDAGTYKYTGDYKLSVDLYTAPPVYNYDQIADQLVNGYWGGDWHHFNVTQGGTITVNITALTTPGQTLARAALKEWTDIIGVTFKEVTTGGQITFDDSDDGAYTTADWSNHITTSAHVNISTQWLADYGTSLNSYSFQSYLHEIGHALGLGHAGNYNETATYPDDAVFSNDAWSATVMSYFSEQESSYFADQNFSYDFTLTPMNGDIVAMQTLYGLSTTTRTGDTTYGYGAKSAVYNASANPDAAYTIFDNGGTDTLNYSLSSADQLINLNPETFSNVAGQIGNMSIAIGTVIENVNTGSGDDTIIGNGADNVFYAGAGNDTLDGGAGLDKMFGGAGNDTYFIRDATDFAYENAGEGTDAVMASVSASLRANIENLTLTGSGSINGKGNDLANEIDGNAGANRLSGLGGNDTLVGDGGRDILDGGAGSDTLQGGGDNDIYLVDSATDLVVENAGAGTDFVETTASYTLSANVERMYLLGSANIDGAGNDLANLIVGNSGANDLSGLGANDRLYGAAGSDTIDGGAGNDYIEGGSGQDDLIGGAGKDYFVFRDGDFGGATASTGDRIEDFALGDRISLSPVDANTAVAGNQAFAFMGTGAFDGHAGELRYEQSGGNTYLSGDTNGDGIADFMIKLDGLHALTTGDLLL